jgi:hypothetical protein
VTARSVLAGRNHRATSFVWMGERAMGWRFSLTPPGAHATIEKWCGAFVRACAIQGSFYAIIYSSSASLAALSHPSAIRGAGRRLRPDRLRLERLVRSTGGGARQRTRDPLERLRRPCAPQSRQRRLAGDCARLAIPYGPLAALSDGERRAHYAHQSPDHARRARQPKGQHFDERPEDGAR